ncbi:MAG: sulfite reductase [Caulobacterales bacterium 68-7]|nr:PepSY domain-containing protein [Caulobacterales bacterium]OJU12234.1 MAG: sulfite reductase [Caulobacterales bacterium 68-7]
MSDTSSSASGALYRAFWRWHFYAGLLVMPVLMLMALTGGLYLFRSNIDDLVYRPLMFVEARAEQASPDAWARAALAAVPGRLASVTAPAAADRPAKLVVESEAGGRRAVYVDPHDGRVLGDIPDGGAMAVVKRVHSLDIAGPVFNLGVEIVAGWAIVMVATGIVLWWPRGQKGGVVSVRGTPARRVFWRDLHAVTGIFVGGVIVFLAATGMPWSAVWGAQVRKMTTAAGWGRPAAPVATAGGHEGHEGHEGHDAPPPPNPNPAVPWALQETTMAASAAPALPLGAMMGHVEALGLPRPYTITIPKAPSAAWSAAYMPDKVEATRTLYLDGATGQAVADIGYARFGPAAKTIEWGIAVHQGQQFGLINKLVMLAGCVAIWLLGISGLTMWWKRRPKGRLAAPPAPADKRGYVALAAVVIPLGLVYPLVGASLIVVLTLDLVLRRLIQPR